jgi:hypothetical protein
MKIIDDKFEWMDKTVAPRIYKIKDGRDYDKSDVIIKLVVSRNNNKKKSLKRMIYLNLYSRTIGHF